MKCLSTLTVCIILAGCGTQLADSNRFVVSCDTLNISMHTTNLLYDYGDIPDKDYKTAAIVFFQAKLFLEADYIMLDDSDDHPERDAALARLDITEAQVERRLAEMEN